MAPIQVAHAPPPEESTRVLPATGGATTPEDLTLQEMLRIMDVATTLRKEQTVVEQQLNLAETKALLRERLLEAAAVTGERLTAEQVDTAIENYYDKLHVFEAPSWGLSTMVAHLYVLRGTIVRWGVAIGAMAGLLVYFS